jgi:uncharacterized protein YjiS (DUF1127 family)
MTCTDTLTHNVSAAASPGRPAVSRAFSSVVQTMQTWQRRQRGRAQLRKLPDHLLRDIGLDPATARREAGKPFWRA